VVFTDTPGIVKPVYRLHESMMRYVKTAITDADIILYVTDVVETPDKNPETIRKLAKSRVPILVAINKSDLSDPQSLESLSMKWKGMLPQAMVISISALHRYNTPELFHAILDKLPEGPPYYPEEDLTDRPERFFISEIIREKIFLNYQKEIPYSCEVVIESFREAEDMVRINAIIYVMRETQKGIIIGHRGEALKKTGIDARKDSEKFLGKKVFLGLQVKVAQDWRNNDKFLKRFGY
jgi:GTP-binding protein Era